MSISWRCARGHLTKSRYELAFDDHGNYACFYCMEEDRKPVCVVDVSRAPGLKSFLEKDSET